MQANSSPDPAGPDLVIGLLNNMPDAALQATERQFQSLIGAASGGLKVRLVRCRIASISRGDAAEAYLAENYIDVESLFGSEIDGLIVTGREPLTSHLRDELYWDNFVQVLEWAREKTSSTVWSCLAAHAAVLHMDDIHRVRNEEKHCGVYECCRSSDHELLSDVPERFRMPHSRWNGLPKEALTRAGYELLAQADHAGVDCFLRKETEGSLFLFFQGHPEYEPDTLLLEYRRDVLRHLRGEAPNWPSTPRGLLLPRDEATVLEIRGDARALPEEETIGRLSELFSTAAPRNGWHQTAKIIYRNWLTFLSEQKIRRQRSAGVEALSVGSARAFPANQLPSTAATESRAASTISQMSPSLVISGGARNS